MEDLKKIMLVLLGSAAVSAEKLDKSLSDLVEKGKLTVKEGKELREELIKKDMSVEKDDPKEVLTKDEFRSILDSLNLVETKELKTLEDRIESLENKLNEN